MKPILCLLLAFSGCATQHSEDSADVLGQIYGLRLRQEFDSRQADIEFKRAEADLMHQHADELRRRKAPIGDEQLFREALRWAYAHLDGGTYVDPITARSQYFTSEQVRNIARNASEGLRDLNIEPPPPQGVIRWREK